MSGPAPPGSGPAPLIVRVAGLPAQTMERFRSDLCVGHLAPMRRLRAELDAARQALADAIFAVLPSADPALRRFLLAVKRDCFNARPLARRARSERWASLCELMGAPAERAIALERDWARAREAFHGAYDRARHDERLALRELCEHPGLIRGLALASPNLVANLHRLAGAGSSKQQADAEASLLRYGSRAALKTSPFSTLTRVGLGVASADVHRAIEIASPLDAERSLLRIKRYITDQDATMLARDPRVRAGLRVAVNSSLVPASDGRSCLLRPGGWQASEGRMRYQPPSLVQLALGGPMIAWLRAELAHARYTHAELVDALSRHFGRPSEEIRGTVDRLCEVGFLVLLPPWPTNEAHLERRMAEHLRGLSDGTDIAAAAARLSELVALEDAYPEAREPLASVRRIHRGIDALWAETRALGGAGAGVERFRHPAGGLYEDVFLVAPGGRWGEVARLSREAADRLSETSEPLLGLARLFHPQLELLHTVAAFAAQRWPGQDTVGVIELLRAFQPVWRAYTQYLSTWRRLPPGAQHEAAFDPLGLAPIEALKRLRQQVAAGLDRILDHSGPVDRLCPSALRALLDDVPGIYRPSVGACLMVQPVEPDGTQWVLNQLLEGTGRLSSRYTHLMPGPLREQYTAYLAARGFAGFGDTQAPFLDLMFSFGDTLNSHLAQTPLVLELPDECLDVEPERKRALSGLFVRLAGDHALPQIVDAAGRACAPVHLSGADESFMPTIVRLLSAFGPGALTLPMLPRRRQRGDGVHVLPRLAIGELIVHRRRWEVSPARIPRAALARASREDAFEQVDGWRCDIGLPDRVFLIEKLQDGPRGTAYKPQYIDFTSPGFVALLVRVLGRDDAALHFEEVLPAPEHAPADADGRRWVVEVQVDALALGNPGLGVKIVV